MTGPAIDTQAAVDVVKSAAGILPEAGKAAVLDHLNPARVIFEKNHSQ